MMSQRAIRVTPQLLLRLAIGPYQIAAFHLMQGKFVRGLQGIGIQSQCALASFVRPLEHRRTASSLTSIMVVAKRESQPCWWISAIQLNRLLEHGYGVLVWLRIV